MDVYIKDPSFVVKAFNTLNSPDKVGFFNSSNEENIGAHIASVLTGIALFVLAVMEFVIRGVVAPFVLLVEYFIADDEEAFKAKLEPFGESFTTNLVDGVVGGLLTPAIALGSDSER